jgi:hypothetical protein
VKIGIVHSAAERLGDQRCGEAASGCIALLASVLRAQELSELE